MPPETSPSARHPTLQVLELAPVRWFLVAQLFSTLGLSLLRATVSWHIWKATGSYALLGTLGLLEFAPVIPLTLVGGALADTADRRSIGMRALGATACLTGALYLSASHEYHEVWVILGTAFCTAVAGAFLRPALVALLPTLVPPTLFPSATVVHANIRNLAFVSGPVVMGVLTQASSIATAYGAAGACMVTAALLLSRLPPAPPPETQRTPVTLRFVGEGIAFVRSKPAILSSMLLDMFAVIFAGATALLPVFADQILGVDEVGYGLLSASLQAGTLLGALVLLVVPPMERPGAWLLGAVVVFGLSTVVFGLSRHFGLSLAAFVVAGMADQVSMTARSIILQLATPDELRGRVSSVGAIFIGASNELGAAESGYLASLTSATFSVVFGGLACLGVVSATALTVPSLRRYRVSSRPR